MGFDSTVAEDALRVKRNNLSKAASFLLDQRRRQQDFGADSAIAGSRPGAQAVYPTVSASGSSSGSQGRGSTGHGGRVSTQGYFDGGNINVRDGLFGDEFHGVASSEGRREDQRAQDMLAGQVPYAAEATALSAAASAPFTPADASLATATSGISGFSGDRADLVDRLLYFVDLLLYFVMDNCVAL
jgi:hypothetical protein